MNLVATQISTQTQFLSKNSSEYAPLLHSNLYQISFTQCNPKLTLPVCSKVSLKLTSHLTKKLSLSIEVNHKKQSFLPKPLLKCTEVYGWRWPTTNIQRYKSRADKIIKIEAELIRVSPALALHSLTRYLN